MVEEQYFTNRELRPELVPSPDADFAEVIYPFAMSYLGYRVWGDQEACWATGSRVWERQEQGGRVPASLTKLRTALFAAGRVMRFTDFDEDVAWDLSTFSESTATSTDAPGSGAVWEAQMRGLVAAIAIEVTNGPRAHRAMARAVASALDELTDSDAVDERGLRVALGNAVAELVDEPVASSAIGHEHTFASLPFWAESDPPGPFDLAVGDPEHPRIAAEVKWSPTNTLSHSLWDILKLLGVLSLSAEHVYLVAGYPDWVWGTKEFPVLFEDGVLDFTSLPLAKEWPSLIKNSKGTPTRIPNAIEITEVARFFLTSGGKRWQLRTVALDPAPGGWLELSDGRLEEASPLS